MSLSRANRRRHRNLDRIRSAQLESIQSQRMVRGVGNYSRRSLWFDSAAICSLSRNILVKAQAQRRIARRPRLASLLISVQPRGDFLSPKSGIFDGVRRATANVTTSRTRHESQSYEKSILRAGRITTLDNLTE